MINRVILMAKVRTQLVAWDDIVSWTRSLAEKIKSSGYRPDLVVAVARGGFVPARLLCDFLLIDNLISIQSQHWTEAAKAEDKAVIKFPYKLDLRGKKVLLVDDIVDTGESLSLAKEFITQNWNADEVKIAVLQWISPVAKFKPDFYHLEVKEWIWFQYPWTRLEDTYQFMKRMLSEESKYRKEWSYSEIVSKFMEWYDLDVGDEYLKGALRMLEESGFLRREGENYIVVYEG